MKITKSDLIEWSATNLTVRYRNELYRVRHEGLAADGTPNGSQVKNKHYFLMPADLKGRPRVGQSISVYHKGRGIYGLATNR